MMDNDEWRAFNDAGSGGRLCKALQTLADWTGYGWMHDPRNPSSLNSTPMTKAKLDALVEKSQTSNWRIGGARRVDADKIEAFTVIDASDSSFHCSGPDLNWSACWPPS